MYVSCVSSFLDWTSSKEYRSRVSKFRGSAARMCERAARNFWARQCGLLTDTSGSHGGTGCFCGAAVICREGNRDIEASAMQDFERMFIDRKRKSQT